MSGRERFRQALAGRDVAFAPLVWEQLPELVRQPADDWWRDPAIGCRLLVDAAALAGADAMFVASALNAPREAGASGDGALDALAGTAEACSGYRLVEALHDSARFGIIAALPDVPSLLRELEADDPDAAEDALADLARGHMDAGADALAVIGAEPDAVRAAARRVAAIGAFYGRPVLGACGGTAWVEGGGTVAVMGEDGEWPPIAAGLVITAGDVSLDWDADRLHAVGSSRP